MANPKPPVLNAEEMTVIASYGGYSNLVPMSEITNLLLLSILPLIHDRKLWQTVLNPIPDALWDVVEQWIDTATGELMTNIAIGSIFYSIALLTEQNVKIPIGQLLLQDDYPALTAIVPGTWLVGDDIQLPDMRNTFVTGTPTGGQNGVITGNNEHVMSQAEMPIHTHIQSPHIHSYNVALPVSVLGGEIPATASLVTVVPSVTGSTTAINQNSGDSEPHNNVPLSLQAYPYLVVS